MRRELKDGDELLGCRIVRLLESGEEHDLYEAEDVHTAQRLAIERLLPSDDERAYEMLRKRIADFRPLTHPNLCAVYGVGEDAGLACVITEYLKGRSLQGIFGTPLGITEKLSVIRQTCDTLSYLHRNGFPFLNIKPSNVILLPIDQIKVVDYWIGGLRPQSNLTASGAAAREILYLAPERLRGAPFDHRADIWAMGVMLYQVLTNRNPFSHHDSATTVVSILNNPLTPLRSVLQDYPADSARTVVSILNDPLTPLRSLLRAYPADFDAVLKKTDAVLKKALAKNPENRYESSAEMAAAINEIEKAVQGFLGPGLISRGRKIPQTPPPVADTSWKNDPFFRPPEKSTAPEGPSPSVINIPSSLAGPGSSAPKTDEPAPYRHEPLPSYAPPRPPEDGGATQFLRLAQEPVPPAVPAAAPESAPAPSSGPGEFTRMTKRLGAMPAAAPPAPTPASPPPAPAAAPPIAAPAVPAPPPIPRVAPPPIPAASAPHAARAPASPIPQPTKSQIPGSKSREAQSGTISSSATESAHESSEILERSLDLALASSVQVLTPVEIVALLRMPSSTPLSELLKEDPDSNLFDMVRSRGFGMEFLRDASGRLRPVDVIMRVIAPDFEPPKMEKRIRVRPDRDCERQNFLLTPQRIGVLKVQFDILMDDLTITSRTLTTQSEPSDRIPENALPVIVSVPLSMEVRRRRHWRWIAAAARVKTQSINSQHLNEQPLARPNMSPELWQRLKPLYARALEMTKSEREQFVHEACGSEIRLREELEVLLNSPSQLETNDNVFLRLPKLFPSETSALAEGETILGRFTIVKRLGAGGMGEVYEATDSELGRIALKTIRPQLTNNDNQCQRFRREVQLARKISSPRVCRVHEFFPAGGDPNPHPAFLTMEFLEGATLAKRIHDLGKLDPRESAEIAFEACEGLNAIHEAGVIHRDLKSQNIMLAARNGRKCVVLMDFGVAGEVLDRTEHSPIELTSTGAIIGTPSYMAPEQFEGKPTSPATDLYALGIVLYEMLTGNAPFTASTPIGAAVQRGKQPIPVTTFRPDLSKRWDIVISKCLQFRAEDRYQTAVDLKSDLESVLIPDSEQDSREIPAGGLEWTSQIRFWLLTIIGLAMVASVGFAAWRLFGPPSTFSSVSITRLTEEGNISGVALFPDGQMLAEVKSFSGGNSVWIRSIPTNAETQILAASPEGYSGLTVSPDGYNLYLVRQHNNDPESDLFEVPVLGGTPRRLLRNVDGPVSFSPDGKRIAYMRTPLPRAAFTSELHVANSDGTDDQLLSANSGFSRLETFSPKGTEIAWVQIEKTGSVLIIFHLKTRRPERLSLPDGVFFIDGIAWLKDGRHLLLNARMPTNGSRPLGQFATIEVPSETFHRVTSDAVSYRGLSLSKDAQTFATLIVGEGTRVEIVRSHDGTLIDSFSSQHSLSKMSWIDATHVAFFELQGGHPGITILDLGTRKFDPTDLFREGEGTILFPGGIVSCSTHTLIGIVHDRTDDGTQLYRTMSDGTVVPIKGTEKATAPLWCSPDGHSVRFVISTPGSTTGGAWEAALDGNGAPRRLFDFTLPRLPVFSSMGGTALSVVQTGGGWSVIIRDMKKGKVVRQFDHLDGFEGGAPIRFSPDERAIEYVAKSAQGFVLDYQPIDGSSPHTIFAFGYEAVKDFQWSPSGEELAVLQSPSTSDVALISEKH